MVHHRKKKEKPGSCEQSCSSTALGDPPQDICESPKTFQGAIEPKRLPHRKTRGLRLQALVGDDAEIDEEFWKLQTWEESDSDQEWSPGKDDLCSSSTSCTSTTSRTTLTNDSENVSWEADDRLLEEEKEMTRRSVAKKRRQVYRDPNTSLGLMTRRTARLKPTLPGRGVYRPKMAVARPSTSQRMICCDVQSQEERLRQAEITEQINTQHLSERVELGNWKKGAKEQKESLTRWTGSMELLVFWASNRLLSGDEKEPSEQHKAEEMVQTLKETGEGNVFCRQLLFFVDYDHPEKTALPSMYTCPGRSADFQAECSSADPAKYKDPLTGEVFSHIQAFQKLRQRENSSTEAFLLQCFASTEEKLKNVLVYIQQHHLWSQLAYLDARAEEELKGCTDPSQVSFGAESNTLDASHQVPLGESLKGSHHTFVGPEAALPLKSEKKPPMDCETKSSEESGRKGNTGTIGFKTKQRSGASRCSAQNTPAHPMLKKLKETRPAQPQVKIPLEDSVERQPLRIHSTHNPYGAPGMFNPSLCMPQTFPSLGASFPDPMYFPYLAVQNPYLCDKQYGGSPCVGSPLLPSCYPSPHASATQNLLCAASSPTIMYPPPSFLSPLTSPLYFLPPLPPYVTRGPALFPSNVPPAHEETPHGPAKAQFPFSPTSASSRPQMQRSNGLQPGVPPCFTPHPSP